MIEQDSANRNTTYFFDNQFRNVESQFVRIFSNFSYMTGKNRTGRKELIHVPCKIGNPSKIAGMIAKKNSENVALTAPFISCWISNVSVARNRTLNPTHISQLQVNEREFDYGTRNYTGDQGSKYLVERLAPVAYDITMQVDIWTTNELMKHQLLEQILILFNPSIDWQKNENPLDWSSLGIIELENINWSSRSVPIGTDDSLDVASLTFQIQHFYLNPPAKVKKQVVIQKIIQDVGLDNGFDENGIMVWQPTDFFPTITTWQNLELYVEGDEAQLISHGDPITWNDIFTVTNNEFVPDLYSIRLRPGYEITYTSADVLLTINSISTNDPTKAIVTLNTNSLPNTTLPAVKDFINPNAVFPDNGLEEGPGYRYIITHDIIPNAEAWGPLQASAGSIIQTYDGINWEVSFNSNIAELGSVVRNLADGELYVHVTDDTWINVYQGQYRNGFWSFVNLINNNISN